MYFGFKTELLKLAGAEQVVSQAVPQAAKSGLLSRLGNGNYKNWHLGAAGLLGAGIATTGGQAIDDWRTGRMYRQQTQAAQGF